MKVELLDVLTPEGERTGTCAPRDELHATGAWHLSVHVWIADGDRVLLQRRADTKESYPGLYDAASAGHVSAGETCPAAAVRETREELGIVLEESGLAFLGTHRLSMRDTATGFVSNEYNYVYLARVDAATCEVHIQEEEVGGVTWMAFDDLVTALEQTPWKFCMDPDEVRMVRSKLYGA